MGNKHFGFFTKLLGLRKFQLVLAHTPSLVSVSVFSEKLHSQHVTDYSEHGDYEIHWASRLERT